MPLLLKLDHCFANLARLCGVLAGIAMILLLFNVFYDVVMRYAFNDVSIGMQELEWHLFSAVFLLGIPYAIRENNHVRVDILYDRWSVKTQAFINLFGWIIKSLIPLSFIMMGLASLGMITSALIDLTQPSEKHEMPKKNLL